MSMGSFERRLSQMQRRPGGDPSGAVSVGTVHRAESIGWEAAERIGNLVDVAPGTVIRLSIDDDHGLAMFEVAWDDEGVVSIRETGRSSGG
jgi:hypothetical protein